MSEPIFLDASFWITFRDPKDRQYEMARAIAGKLAQSRPIFVTTMLVAAETHAYFSRNRTLRTRVLDDIQSSPIFRVEQITHEDERHAFELLRQRDDKSYSLCDAISFCLMQRLKILRVLSLDDHFSQTGLFQVIDHPDLV